MKEYDYIPTDEDFKKDYPKEFNLGYNSGAKAYENGLSRELASELSDRTNPYDNVKGWEASAWQSGFYNGYNDEEKLDIKTNLNWD